MTQSPDAWLNSELNSLSSIGLPTVYNREVAFPARPWTFLKLSVLRAYIDRVYLPILRQRYRRLVFVDLFAGSGLCRYQNAGIDEMVPGSAAIGASFRQGPGTSGFDVVVLVEKDGARLREAVEVAGQRGFTFGTNLFGIASDANVAVTNVSAHLRPSGTHALVFADSDRLEPALDTIRRIVKSHPAVDVFVTHLNAGSARGAASSESSTTRDAFYGTHDWSKESSREGLSRLYERQLGTIRDHVEVLHIRGGAGTGDYRYDLLFGVRETGGHAPFMNFIRSVGKKLDRLDGDAVSSCLRTRFRSGPPGKRTIQRKIDCDGTSTTAIRKQQPVG
jgi:three-Cys-motif partner protein